ncbi:baseplate multidomain protein megatron [Roseibium sediminis]|uniref:baseplate multidomain protein megatron n=1 Tax=Roseibium sediminis TaxID=1775174 RepID=UPI00123D1DDC|nr:glycoside hydrolase/phage tail family protein [Roseibium sediminis]
MATLILAAAGQALGAALGAGGFGAIVGKAAGALIGGALDQNLFGSTRTIEGARLKDLDVQASTEGASLPKVYGRVRLAGQIIWSTRFEEVVSEEKHGGKGGRPSVKVKSYAYFASFAVGICEGPIVRIGRVWADGKEIDPSAFTMRVHQGADDQMPDPLIAAVQGGATPAYRGTAYVVFERLPLENFGNRLPQLSFEVIRPVDHLEKLVQAVTIIPGAGEFVYAPGRVTSHPKPGVTESINAHVPGSVSDWTASIDELQALCPNLKRVALIVAWFGDDLRAGHCTIRPKVEEGWKQTSGASWSVAGVQREDAVPVSRVEDRPAYGGTPSDETVIAAIRDLKARGLEVMVTPFVLMDIPPDNSLPDPYGGTKQAAFPWRGRIMPGADPVAEAAQFFGSASAGHFHVAGDTVSYSGPQEWQFRRHVLHCAALAKAAGGVEAFLIGTEMRGLTRAHAGNGHYPFVDQWAALAAEVRALLGSGAQTSYAADWSEYGAHQVAAGELRFPLDPLWASPHIDFIGIDNYLPLADQRDGGDPDGNRNPYDVNALRDQIEQGELHDWYYASEADRLAGLRTPISDGAAGKPWVYKAKDIRSWWANPHHERVGGSELHVPTAWSPMSKPIRFTELGFPAIDRGANQPNVFVDPKSSENAMPHFSRGNRDDLIQRRALEAHLSYWGAGHPLHPPADQPVSPVYGGPMIDPAGIYLWTWDARPYPAFPRFGDVWADGDNWMLGHWLTGRLGASGLTAVIMAILEDFGLSASDFQVHDMSGSIDGIAIPGPVSARQVLEPLLSAYGGIAADCGTHVVLKDHQGPVVWALEAKNLAEPAEEGALLSRKRAQANELAHEVRFSAHDPLSDFRTRIAASRRLEGGSRTIESADLAAVLQPADAQSLAERRLHRIWQERERVQFALGPAEQAIDVGDMIELGSTPFETFSPPLRLRVENIEETDRRQIEATVLGTGAPSVIRAEPVTGAPFKSTIIGPPHHLMLDLPVLTEDDVPHAPRLAVFSSPWPGSYVLYRSTSETGFEAISTIDRPAIMGRLTSPLETGPLWRWDTSNIIDLEMFGGHLESRTENEVLSGGNVLAVECRSGGFEILQFRSADLVSPGRYRLSGLLRGQKGTEMEMANGADAGAAVVMLDAVSVPQVPLAQDLAGQAFSYLLVPQGMTMDDPSVVRFDHVSNRRGSKPLAPVHLTACREEGGIWISWVRRTRYGGDSWEQAEVPLAEEREAYEVDILGSESAVLRTLSTATPHVLYETAAELADFGAPVSELSLSAVQLSATYGRGAETRATIHV